MLLVLLIYCAALAFLSLNPWARPDSGQAIGEVAWDKIDHAIAYCLLSLLMMSVFRFYKQQKRVVTLVLLMSSGLGILLEYCQLWFYVNPHVFLRYVIANVFGAVFGVIVYSLAKNLGRLPREYF